MTAKSSHGVVVTVIAEGVSDEEFLKRVVAPTLHARQIYLKPLTIETSPGHSGGAVSYDRLKFNARNILRQRPDTYLTTFLDLYALDTSFPGAHEAFALNGPARKAGHIEARLHESLVSEIGCRPDRFFAHVQPYELEGLFFSNTTARSEAVPGWQACAAQLQAQLAGCETPEHLNGRPMTHPSQRLADILVPRYQKRSHAPLIGERIGLQAIAASCPHFGAWVSRLTALEPL